ncbi:hypothetical protein JMJ77_0000194, partial [Colletotrichum scovillei]
MRRDRKEKHWMMGCHVPAPVTRA